MLHKHGPWPETIGVRFEMMIKNKKGDSLGFVGKAIIMILVLVVSTIIFSNIMHANTTLIQCTKQGGECTSAHAIYSRKYPSWAIRLLDAKKGTYVV